MRSRKLGFAALLSVGVATALSSSQAHAQLVQLSSASQLNPADTTTPTYPGSIRNNIASPFTLSAGGNMVTFTATNGSTFFRANPAVATDYPAGTSLIETSSVSGDADGPLRIDFSQPIGEFGLRAQNTSFDFETFTFSAFNGGTLLGSFTTPSTDNTSNNGKSLFLGAKETSVPSITSITISSTSNVTGGANNFFVGPVTFGKPTATPEPGSLALLVGLGVSGAGFLIRRRKDKR